MTIVWNTDVVTDGVIQYGPTQALGMTATDPSADSKVHVVTLTGLDPDSTYHYRVRSNGTSLTGKLPFKTFPADGASGDYRILAWGDSGTGESEQVEVATRIGLLSPDLCLMAGDIVYRNGEAENFDPRLFEPYADIFASCNFYPTLGNHDVGTNNGQPYIDALYLPTNNPQNTERYYSFDYGDIHVIGLDTTQSFNSGSAQYDWLEEDLATMGGFWTVVFHHHTPYTTSTTHANSPEGADIRAHLGPLFDLYGVDLDVAGHTHAFERTFPVFGDAVVSANQEPNYSDPGGTIYITTGGGGRRLYDHDTEHPNNDYLVNFIKEFHVTALDFDGNELEVEVVERDGSVLDAFDLTKSVDTSAPFLSSIDVTNIKETKVTIVWDTDELADSRVEYGVPPNFDFQVKDSFRTSSHSLKLSGLTEGTEYQFRVRSKDRAGNSSTSNTLTFNTGGDAAAPALSGIMAASVTTTSATIEWTTDEPADSFLEFGATPDFSETRSESDLTLDHSFPLTGLLPGQEYQYQITSADAGGNSATSAVLTFVTVEDTTGPEISSLSVVELGERVARIEWTTDEDSTSRVDFGLATGALTQTVSDEDLETTHTLLLEGLVPSTDYFFQVTSEDIFGNDNSSEVASFRTDDDTTGPTISSVAAVNVEETQALITWTTDEEADSVVEYGVTVEYGQGEISAAATVDHAVLLTGIFAGNEYHYRVRSTDLFGNLSLGPTLTFITEGDSLDPHTVAYWRLDDNLLDEAPGARHGSVDDVATFSTEVPREIVPQTGVSNSRSFLFDGANSVQFPDFSLGLLDAQSGTFECFFRATAMSGNQTIFFQGDPGGEGFGPEDGMHLYVTEAGAVGFLQFQLGAPNIFVLSSEGSVNAGIWHHVAITFDGDVAQLFVDGVPAGSDSSFEPFDKTNWGSELHLGRSPVVTGVSRGWVGEIDELRFLDQPITTGQFLSTETLFRLELSSPSTVERTDPFSILVVGTSTSLVHGFDAKILYDPELVDFVGDVSTAFVGTVWEDAESLDVDVDSAAGEVQIEVLREATGANDKPPIGPFRDGLFGVLAFRASACTAEVQFEFDLSDSTSTELVVEDFGPVTVVPSVESNVTSLHAEETFLRGDANAGGPIDPDDPQASITLADGVYLLNALYLDGPAPPCQEAADVNADGRLNVVDAIFLLQHVFGSSGAISVPAPWPNLGRAPDPSFSCDNPPASVCNS